MYQPAGTARVCMCCDKTCSKRAERRDRSALKEISEFEAAYRVLEYPEDVWQQWKRLVRTSELKGLRLHDAYIGAVMVGHGIKYILTLNIKDFQDLQGIKPVKPEYWQKIT